MADAINPYRPPSAKSDGRNVINAVAFSLTRRDIRYGRSHHMIRCHPVGVSVVSLVMIGLSIYSYIFAYNYFGARYALVSLPFAMATSAIAYIAVIARSRRRTNARLQELSLAASSEVSLRIADKRLFVDTPGALEPMSWPIDEVSSYRTPRGTMVVMEKYAFVFLPRFGKVHRSAYKQFTKELKKRS